MKRVLATITIVLAGLSLAGCAGFRGLGTSVDSTPAPAEHADSSNNANTPATTVFTRKLPDGRTITCMWAEGVNENGGLSCDWADAK